MGYNIGNPLKNHLIFFINSYMIIIFIFSGILSNKNAANQAHVKNKICKL